MVKARNKPLRQIVIKIRLHRGGTRLDFIENCPHRLGITDVNHVPITFIKFQPNGFHVESYYRCYILLFDYLATYFLLGCSLMKKNSMFEK